MEGKLKLKPCPFCGGRAKIEKLTIKKLFLRATGYFITCQSCRVFTGAQLEIDAAIEAWNRRNDARQKERWIPVSEGLPENGEEVLASDGTYIYLVEYEADLDVAFGDIDNIIAWRPLPEPYKE